MRRGPDLAVALTGVRDSPQDVRRQTGEKRSRREGEDRKGGAGFRRGCLAATPREASVGRQSGNPPGGGDGTRGDVGGAGGARGKRPAGEGRRGSGAVAALRVRRGPRVAAPPPARLGPRLSGPRPRPRGGQGKYPSPGTFAARAAPGVLPRRSWRHVCPPQRLRPATQACRGAAPCLSPEPASPARVPALTEPWQSQPSPTGSDRTDNLGTKRRRPKDPAGNKNGDASEERPPPQVRALPSTHKPGGPRGRGRRSQASGERRREEEEERGRSGD